MVAPAVKQTWTVMGVLVNMLSQGMVLSFPSILLPAVQSPGSEIKADLHTASWLASCVGVSSMPGLLISSFLMDWLGRKTAQIIMIIPGTIGWILISFASNVTVLMIGRILCGFTAGPCFVLAAVIIGEYTSPRHRGMFLNLKTTVACLGNMMVHILGNFLAWKHVAHVALVPQIVAMLIIFTWPESLAWLASKKRFKASETSFYWLRGTSDKSKREIDELIRAQKERLDGLNSATESENILIFFKKISRRNFLKPLIVMVFAGLLQEACGRHIFSAFAIQIVNEVTGNNINSFYYTLGVDLIITVSALFSSALVKVMRRRTLLFSTGFAALFVLACVCMYLYLVTKGIMSNNKPWVPMLLFSVYFILSNLGCTPIPYALLGEIFPLVHRSVGVFLSSILMSLFFIIGMKVTPYLLVSVKVYGTFAIFGSVMGLALVTLCFILPETNDKTLQEIENNFNGGKIRQFRVNDDNEVEMKMIPDEC
ncbi:facilitated trehalose transporter Tret1-like [Bicyclus anynana]|uniref:Facilitated trehalose transporter Tret1-like n=1 Tax=Bicyclus anynana TaxID=110368 RepID=A0ABM3M1C9_BICAN|nr:facilitated trehalose transporter Tret1-like [Bicyclus anynana]